RIVHLEIPIFTNCGHAESPKVRAKSVKNRIKRVPFTVSRLMEFCTRRTASQDLCQVCLRIPGEANLRSRRSPLRVGHQVGCSGSNAAMLFLLQFQVSKPSHRHNARGYRHNARGYCVVTLSKASHAHSV